MSEDNKNVTPSRYKWVERVVCNAISCLKDDSAQAEPQKTLITKEICLPCPLNPGDKTSGYASYSIDEDGEMTPLRAYYEDGTPALISDLGSCCDCEDPTADAVDDTSIMIIAGELSSISVAQNDAPCDFGDTTYQIDPSTLVNLSVVNSDNQLGVFSIIGLNAGEPFSFGYDILCDGQVVDSAVVSGQTEAVVKQCIEFNINQVNSGIQHDQSTIVANPLLIPLTLLPSNSLIPLNVGATEAVLASSFDTALNTSGTIVTFTSGNGVRVELQEDQGITGALVDSPVENFTTDACGAQTPEVLDIIILSGQSNAYGLSPIADLSGSQLDPIEDVKIYNSWHDGVSNATTTQRFARWQDDVVVGNSVGVGGNSSVGGSPFIGTEVGFAKRAEEINLTTNPLGILKYAVGASMLHDGTTFLSDFDVTTPFIAGIQEGDAWEGWKNAITDSLLKLDKEGIQYNIVGLIWYQGESDGVEGITNPGSIENKLEELFTALKIHLNSITGGDYTNLPTVTVAPANPDGTQVSWGGEYLEYAKRSDFIGEVSAEDFHDGVNNDVHLSGNDMYNLGVAVADRMSEAIAGNAIEGGSFSPADISTALWIDANDPSNYTFDAVNTNELITVRDKSGSNEPYSFMSGNGQYVASDPTANNKGVIPFNSGVYLESDNPLLLSNDQVWYIVVKTENTDNQQDAIWSTDAFVTNISNSPTSYLSRWFYQNQPAGGLASFLGQDGEWNIYEVQWNVSTNTSDVWFNGNVVSSGNTFSISPLSNGFGVGQTHRFFAQYLSPPLSIAEGFLAESIITDGVSNREEVEGYLAHKFGISSKLPASHPYKTTAP